MKLRFERLIFALALLTGLPGVALSLVLLWTGPYADRTRWTLALLVALPWLAVGWMLRERVVRPLQTLSNLLAAVREGDFSFRARGARHDDALGLALVEANALGEQLRKRRLAALESGALLSVAMAEIPTAIFALDAAGRLRLVNRAGERLLDTPAPRLLGRTADAVGLDGILAEGDAVPGDASPAAPRVLDRAFPDAVGRWELRQGWFRWGGEPHRLLVLSDLSRTLREEERQAWQRLARVLSHEINNSLAPIHSLSSTLSRLVTMQPEEWQSDLREGLAVIEARSGALGRFISAFARLARLPPPELGRVLVAEWVHRVAALERRVPVHVRSGPEVAVRGDPVQLDQLLINLVRNAADAAAETRGEVELAWTSDGRLVTLPVLDSGPGLPSSGNLFVPFFTTKPEGSGIGLALSREIAETHGGTIGLADRADGPGAEAVIRLPFAPLEDSAAREPPAAGARPWPSGS